jgi:hypothetical protein
MGLVLLMEKTDRSFHFKNNRNQLAICEDLTWKRLEIITSTETLPDACSLDLFRFSRMTLTLLFIYSTRDTTDCWESSLNMTADIYPTTGPMSA